MIFQLDALPFIASVGSQTMDVTLTDPPYNKEAQQGARSVYDGRTSGPSALGKGGEGIAWHLTDDDISTLVRELVRVTRRWCLVFCALEQLGVYRRAALKAWTRAGMWSPDYGDDAPFFAGAWDRNDSGTPQLSADRPAQGAEGVAVFHNPTTVKRWNGRGGRGIWRHTVDRSEGRHPNQKPYPLAVELVSQFTEPGELVFDPYCGSGVFGRAALALGRRYIGNDAGVCKVSGIPYAVSANESLRRVA